jgi:hypothetical protein
VRTLALEQLKIRFPEPGRRARMGAAVVGSVSRNNSSSSNNNNNNNNNVSNNNKNNNVNYNINTVVYPTPADVPPPYVPPANVNNNNNNDETAVSLLPGNAPSGSGG